MGALFESSLVGSVLPIPTLFQIKFTLLACYNFDVHKPILMILAKNLTEKVSNRHTMVYILPQIDTASALPAECELTGRSGS